jgi:bifunctional non-homologous end joining protein LigD
MPLEEYRRKRDFERTPEPVPGPIKTRKEELSYLIQKHDATRLHYDFRLELDGVLLSWAVTKGPSLNPSDKRLAVRTEDHPISYGSFEGTIPKGEYGGGTVMLWDNGTWEPVGDPQAGLKKGHLSFILHGERLKGRWDLIRMRGDAKRQNWLLIKENDAEARKNANGEFLEDLSFSVKTGRSMDEIASGAAPRKAGPPKKEADSGKALTRLMQRYPEVQLATLVDKPPDGPQWVHEVKLDGYRLLGFVAGGAARLRTRNGKDWTESFPSLSAALEKLTVKNAVLDMEAVVVNAEGKSSFQALQEALGDGGKPNKIVAYVFDLLHLDGQDLTKLLLTARKEKLERLLGSKQDTPLRYSSHIVGQGAEMFVQACGKHLEGIVSKKADAPYIAGRQKTWLKSKCAQRQEFVILGFSDARKGERALGALYLGYRRDGALRYAGKVGTGFTMKSARDLAARFATLAVRKPVLTRAESGGLTAREYEAIRWVKPVLLCEVAFTEWTQDGRIRHPSFQGLREDKDARDVRKEAPEKKAGGLVLNGIAITHPDRVISETGHITKGDLAEYYAGVASFILPRIARRPLSLLRCPSGIDGECFYQRNPGKGMGPDIHPFEFKHKGKKYEYLYIEDEKGLLEVVQMGAIEIHPWGARIDSIDYPDRLVFDLDPAPDVPFAALKLAAKDKWSVVKSFAASVADEMVAAAPGAYIATMSKAKRSGKIFIDYFRNDYTATAIADYAVRARPGAPVAVPLDWNELPDLKSASSFTMKDVLKRLKGTRQDSFSRQQGQRIPAS